MIRDRVIRKTYTMVVHGQIHSSGVINADLIKDREENQVRIADGTCTEDGRRRAVTIYRPVKTGTRATVVEADLITGRSHQLRVHMASIGHPLLGDGKYGVNKVNRASGYLRQALCSYKLTFAFTTDAEELQYLSGRTFEIDDIPFVKDFYAGKIKV